MSTDEDHPYGGDSFHDSRAGKKQRLPHWNSLLHSALNYRRMRLFSTFQVIAIKGYLNQLHHRSLLTQESLNLCIYCQYMCPSESVFMKATIAASSLGERPRSPNSAIFMFAATSGSGHGTPFHPAPSTSRVL